MKSRARYGSLRLVHDKTLGTVMRHDLDSIRRRQLLRRIRAYLRLFLLGLVLSGMTAFPIAAEVALLESWAGEGSRIGNEWPVMGTWIAHVQGVTAIDHKYPFAACVTDWFAFAHRATDRLFVWDHPVVGRAQVHREACSSSGQDECAAGSSRQQCG